MTRPSRFWPLLVTGMALATLALVVVCLVRRDPWPLAVTALAWPPLAAAEAWGGWIVRAEAYLRWANAQRLQAGRQAYDQTREWST